MSGIINGSIKTSATSAAPTLKNPLLHQAEMTLESSLAPDNRQNYHKIVEAGMRAGLQGGPNSILASLEKSKDPIADSATGAWGLVMVLRKAANGVMPEKAMIPAAATLMFYALDFAEQAKLAKIGEAELAEAGKVLGNAVMHTFKITPDVVRHLAARTHAMTQDPKAMEAMNLKVGLVRHPAIPTPTPMPS